MVFSIGALVHLAIAWPLLGILCSCVFAELGKPYENSCQQLIPGLDFAQGAVGQKEHGLSDGFALELHEVVFTVEDTPTELDTHRHHEEKAQLLQRLSRKHGAWDSHHPRHRLLDALHSFQRYKEANMAELNRVKGLYKHVSKKQKRILEQQIDYSQKFDRIEELLGTNHDLCQRIVDTALEFYNVDVSELDKHVRQREASGYGTDRVSVSQSLKHFVRDWSDAGICEREPTFPCLLRSLADLFADPLAEGQRPKVLVPGAGLGRLGHEIAKLGFEVDINEWSMYMNVAYRFLERYGHRGSHSLHPFIDSWSHHASTADMLRAIPFPDVSLNANSVLMVEGDFTTVFKGREGKYDVVVTYFFIDTARNLMSYFDTIHLLLRPGGYWINFGPLLYGTGPFVQLSLDEIVTVTESMGFVFSDTPELCGNATLQGKVRGKEAIYGFDDRALTKNAYNAQFWVAQKV